MDVNYRDVEPRLRAYLRKRGVSANDVDDIAQEAIAALLTIAQRETIDEPFAYLLGIARNMAVDHFRRAKREPIAPEIFDGSSIMEWGRSRSKPKPSERKKPPPVDQDRFNMRITERVLSGWTTREAIAREFRMSIEEVDRIVRDVRAREVTVESDLKRPTCGDE